MVLVSKPVPEGKLLDTKNYKKTFQLTLDLAEACRKVSDGVKVYVVLGPYPVDLIRLSEHMPLESARDILLSGMDLAKSLVEEGKVIALGEIGRPHFPVDDELMQCSNEILRYGMECAKEAGCPVVLHTESADEGVWKQLAEMADSTGLPREKVIKHFAPPAVDIKDNFGLFPSVLASKKSIREAVKISDRFLMETDFLDDPRRPGAVLGIATVPKVCSMLLREELVTEEQLIRIHKDNFEKVYGIEMEL